MAQNRETKSGKAAAAYNRWVVGQESVFSGGHLSRRARMMIAAVLVLVVSGAVSWLLTR
jgi:hypothetical protein